MDLHKIGIKYFAEQDNTINLVDFIPVFHNWIQNKRLDDLLIDVADYSHIHSGPGIVLVAHEGNYAVDETGNRRGMLYYSKHEITGELSERIISVSRKALLAARLLEDEESIKGKIQFPGNELQFVANDRLLAPNNEETHTAIEPVLKDFLGKLYPGEKYSMQREPDPKERYQVTVRTPEPVAISTLLERISQ